VAPVLIDGNPKCGDLGIADCDVGFKFDFNINSPITAIPDDCGTGGIVCFPDQEAQNPDQGFALNGDGKYVDWTSFEPGVCAVIVKGGPNANVYLYDGTTQSDDCLVTPTNQNNGQPYDISHVEFCYDPGAADTDTDTDTDVDTDTDTDTGESKLMRELSNIQTTTNITAVGDVVERQSYSTTYVNDGRLASPAGTNNALIDAYMDALEDADPLGLNNGGGENDALLGGDPDRPYPFGETPVLYGTMPGFDGQTWRDIAGYPGNVGLNATLRVPPSKAFELAGAIAAEADFDDLPDVDRGLGRGDSIVEITYEQEFRANNGSTALRKTFHATDADTPNLEVSKDLAFEPIGSPTLTAASSLTASAELDERLGMSIVNYGGTSSVAAGIADAAALCPWVQGDGAVASDDPAFNESVAARFQFDAQFIVAETDSTVTTATDSPSLQYSIRAAGPAASGGLGVGTIGSAFAAQTQKGFDAYVPPTTRTVYVDARGNVVDYNPNNANDVESVIEGRIVPVEITLPGTGIPALSQFEQYEESIEADGLWRFSKIYEYNSDHE
jgi:hypothetical protein